MSMEVGTVVHVKCDKCGKQKAMSQGFAVGYPDGWKKMPNKEDYCEECYKKYEAEKEREDRVVEHIGKCITITQRLKEIITESDEHTIPLKDALEFIELYGLRNLFNAPGDMHYVGMVACEVIDKAIKNGEIMICKNALKHNE